MARVVNNKFIKTDPIISQFNEHEHFLRIVVEAFSEYVLEISQTGSDYHNSTHFLQVAERNICFSYICYFLFFLVRVVIDLLINPCTIRVTLRFS